MRKPSSPPANELQAEVWTFLTRHLRVKREDVRQACSGSNGSINVYLDQLFAEGVLKPCGRQGRVQFYTVHDEEDQADITAQRRATPEGSIWRTMRILREFSPDDLGAALLGTNADIAPNEIQAYCSLLVRAGYLLVLRKAGKVRSARYRLARDTGPLPPTQKRLPVVIDGNEDRIVFAKGERL